MVGIYKYENGLKFTGIVAESEERAWEYLDAWTNKHYPYFEKTYGVKVTANRNAYKIKEVTLVL